MVLFFLRLLFFRQQLLDFICPLLSLSCLFVTHNLQLSYFLLERLGCLGLLLPSLGLWEFFTPLRYLCLQLTNIVLQSLLYLTIFKLVLVSHCIYGILFIPCFLVQLFLSCFQFRCKLATLALPLILFLASGFELLLQFLEFVSTLAFFLL